jgi:hypothetical protein
MRKSAEEVADEHDLLSSQERERDRDEPKLFADRARDLLGRVQEEAQEHPFRTVGWAAGAGFVLGGGLFTPLTARTVRAGVQVALRLAVIPALTRGLAQMAGDFLENASGYSGNAGNGGTRAGNKAKQDAEE